MFGRKTSPPQDDPKNQPGHQAVLEHLKRNEANDPTERAQLVGRILFEWSMEVLKDERGVRAENMLAMLASVGGHQCLAPILDQLAKDGRHCKEIGMMEVETKDGQRFYFGDLPNKLLIESQLALLSLAMGSAQEAGASVSMEMIQAEMGKVAGLVGSDEFFDVDLPERNAIDSPLNWAKAFNAQIVQHCELYDLHPMQRSSAIGFALYRVIDATKGAIDPNIAASIALQCAVRMAKVDPQKISAD